MAWPAPWQEEEWSLIFILPRVVTNKRSPKSLWGLRDCSDALYNRGVSRLLYSPVRMLMPEASLLTVRLQDCLRRMYVGDATAADELLPVPGDRWEWLFA